MSEQQQTGETPVINAAALLAEAEADFRGEPLPEPATNAAADTVEGDNDETDIQGDADDTAAEGEEADIDEGTGEGDNPDEVDEPKAEKPKRKGEAARLKEKVDAERARADALQGEIAEMKKQMQATQDLMQKLLAGEPEKETKPSYEPLDEEADKHFKSELEKRDKQSEYDKFLTKVEIQNAIGQVKDQQFEQKSDFVIAAEALQIMQRGHVTGRQISQKEAIEKAVETVMGDMYSVNMNGGSMADYIIKRADMLGFAQKVSNPQEKTGQKPKTTVNMRELEKLKASAGAPQNKSAAAEVIAFDAQSLLKQAESDMIRERESA